MPEKKEFSFYLYDKPTLVIIDWFNIWKKNKDIDLQLLFDYLKSYPEVYQIRFYNGLIKGKDWSQRILDNASQIGFKIVTKTSKLQPVEINEADHFESILSSLDDLFKNISSTNSNISNNLYTIKATSVDNFNLIDDMDASLKLIDKDIIKFKEDSKKPIHRTKCDFDAEIARDSVLEIEKYENLILFSGDGDFASTVNYLIQEKNKRVFVMYCSGSYGESDYMENGLIYFDQNGDKKYKKGFSPVPVYRIIDKIKKAPADFSAGPDMNNIAKSDQPVKI